MLGIGSMWFAGEMFLGSAWRVFSAPAAAPADGESVFQVRAGYKAYAASLFQGGFVGSQHMASLGFGLGACRST